MKSYAKALGRYFPLLSEPERMELARSYPEKFLRRMVLVNAARGSESRALEEEAARNGEDVDAADQPAHFGTPPRKRKEPSNNPFWVSPTIHKKQTKQKLNDWSKSMRRARTSEIGAASPPAQLLTGNTSSNKASGPVPDTRARSSSTSSSTRFRTLNDTLLLDTIPPGVESVISTLDKQQRNWRESLFEAMLHL
ncbi:unnamed protein product, partial [Amoebophrya sp. A120]|eukprot:GSA120T00011952001.1